MLWYFENGENSETLISSQRQTSLSSGAFAQLSVHTELGSCWKDLYEVSYMSIFRKSVEKIQISWKYDKNNGYFIWKPKYILIIPRSILLRMRNVLDTSCTENQNTDFMFHNLFFRKSFRLWDIVSKIWYSQTGHKRQQNKAQALYVLAKATHTRREYVAPTAFPWQQRLRERVSMSRYMYIACLLLACISFRSVSLLIPQYNIFFNQLWLACRRDCLTLK